MVYYRGSRPEFFHGWPFRASGSLGNADFWDSVVILDLGSHPRFGVLRKAPAGGEGGSPR